MIKWSYLALIIGLLLGQGAFSQVQSGDPMQRFLLHFKERDFNGFYQSYSPDLAKKVTLEQSSDFMGDMLQSFGDITHLKPLDWQNSNTLIYEVHFEAGDALIFGFRINEQKQIDYFQVFTLPEVGQNQDFLQADYTQIITQGLDSLVNNSQVSFALINKQEVTFLDVRSKAGKLVFSPGNNKIYPILNLSDVLTNTLLAKAITDKEITLGKTANHYYDFNFNNDLSLNLIALSNQRTSLPILPEEIFQENLKKGDSSGAFYKEDLEKYLKDYIHQDTANAQVYSYLNGAIISQVLQKHYKKDYQELLRENILEPYGMHHTFVGVPNKKRRVVFNNDQRAFIALNQNDAFIPSIGLYSTTQDLAKFIQAQFIERDQVLSFSRKPTAIISSNILASTAWKIEQTYYNENYIYFNTGLSSSFVNMMVFDPVSQCGVVILSNVNNSKNQQELFALANALMIKLLYNS